MIHPTPFKKFCAAQAFGLISIFALMVLTTFGQTPKTGEAQNLLLNQPLTRQIKGGETHVFQFNVKAGFYARAEVEQKNIDVVVSLFAPDGKLVVEMDGKDGRLWREAVSCIAERDGAYRVEIKADGTAEMTGSFTVKVVEQRKTKAKDRQRIEAERHFNAGGNLYSQSKYKEAVEDYETAVNLWSKLGEANWEAITLVNLGWAYSSLSKNDQSIAAHEKAIAIFQKVKDRIGEGWALSSFGTLYSNLIGEFGKARIRYEQALTIQREIKDRRSEAATLILLGNALITSSLIEKMKDCYEQALVIKQEIKDRRGEAEALAGLSIVYVKLGQYEKTKGYSEKAKNYVEQSLLISRELKDRRGEAATLVNLGKVYNSLYEFEKMKDSYEQALLIQREIKDQRAEIATLITLGHIYSRKSPKNEKAKDYFEQALLISRETQNRSGERSVYWSLMTWFERQKNFNLAILYGKQAVNVDQEIRVNSKDIEKSSKAFFILNFRNSPYRRLSDILIAEGRFLEAQAVLDLLKEDEYKEIVTRRSGETPDTVPYSKTETDVIKQIESLAALEREHAEFLKQKEKASLPADKQARFDRIPTEIEAANRAFRLALDALGKSESSSTDRVAEIQSEKSLQRTLAQLSKETDSGAVAIYTVLGTEGEDGESKTKFGWIILVTPTSRKAYPIDVADLEQTVFQFRDALTSDKYDPKPAAQKLYQKLFRQTSAKQKTTLEDDLKTLLGDSKDKTLMWSLDGILRYVPMAALHDGTGYLVEKYRSVIFTKESFLTLMEKDAAKWQVLGLGVSERRENFNALPGAERELKDIVRLPQTKTGILDGTIKLNKDFSEEATLKLWREGTFPVIHIASHYSFNSTDPTSSFLLVGDGHLSFSEMQDKDNLFGAVDLLTLSACDTGLSGNGKEAEGFAYLAQSLGAKSVIASLWQVSDTGTPEMMTRFYELRKTNPKMPKGEAFRQAQLAMLGAKTKKDAAKINETKENQILFLKDPESPFAHPHYWSSFVLIGNWR